MKTNKTVCFNWRQMLALAAGVLLLLTAPMGCGDDDDDSAAGSGGGTAGSGGAGGDAGTGGSTAGTGGTAGSAGAAPPVDVTPELKAELCQCFLTWDVLPDQSLVAECEANIADACASCVAGEVQGLGLSSCSEAGPEARAACSAACAGTIPAPTTAQECIDLAALDTEAMATTPEGVTDCMCNNCLDTFAQCMVLPECIDVVMCCSEAGFGGMNCAMDAASPCVQLITDVGLVNADALMMANEVGSCNTENRCDPRIQPPSMDGGFADGGGNGVDAATATDAGAAQADAGAAQADAAAAQADAAAGQ